MNENLVGKKRLAGREIYYNGKGGAEQVYYWIAINELIKKGNKQTQEKVRRKQGKKKKSRGTERQKDRKSGKRKKGSITKEQNQRHKKKRYQRN